jgi:hypothetical protein
MVCDLVQYVLDHPELDWTNVVLWKMDLRSAYTLLFFRPQDVALMAVELAGAIVVVFLCGVFGWSATPACFQVVNRAIVHELRRCLTGHAFMYVDDIIGWSPPSHAASDMATAAHVCTDLLGPDAIAHEKTEHTSPSQRSIDVIGYRLDLDAQVVTLTDRNFLRTIYAFFSVDTSKPVPVPTIERLASLASVTARSVVNSDHIPARCTHVSPVYAIAARMCL